MRPLTLRFKGLRSYRTEQEIDFTRTDLMAIVGDTGAGKSSLLEALYFALYGGCTWNALSARDLVAAGGDGTLRVALTFRAKGKMWKVTRTVSVGGRSSTHRLECLDDKTVQDKAAEIKPIIENLVGLTGPAFLKSVVLPQGRFQELLQTSGAERAKVLKGILGLEDLETVRAHAETLQRRLIPLLNKDIQRRFELGKDPDAVIADASTRCVDAAERVGRYGSALSTINSARTAEGKAATESHQHRVAADKLEASIPANTLARYAKLAEVHDGLVTETEKLAAELAAATALAKQHHDALADAETSGTGIAGTATAVATLSSLRTELASITTEARELAAEQEEVETARSELGQKATGLAELEKQAGKNQQSLVTTLARHKETQEWELRCHEVLAKARRESADARDAAKRMEEAQGHLSESKSQHEAAQDVTDRAEEALGAAETELETARLADAAAHAASSSAPGDPCPVCARSLPEDFTQPPASDIPERRRAVVAAKKHFTGASDVLATAKSDVHAKRQAVAGLEEILEALSAARDSAIEAVVDLLGEVDLAAVDEAILAAPINDAKVAAEAAELAGTAAEKAAEILAAARNEIGRTTAVLERQDIEIGKKLEKLGRRRAEMKTDHETLPAAFRAIGDWTQAALTKTIEAAQARQEELDQVKGSLEQARKNCDQLQMLQSKVNREVRDKVEKPLSRLSEGVVAVATLSASAAEPFGFPEPPARPLEDSIQAGQRWAGDIIGAAQAVITACRQEAIRLTEIAEAKQAEISAALAAAEVPDGETLDEALTEAKVDLRTAQRAHDRAVADKPLWDELSGRINQAKPVLESLHEVQGLLSDGRFVAAVVNRRQRTLLAVASKLLRSMSRQRFGFAADFRIIDGHTGQPREVKTLSGGETFLASLALALAMVELTARGGARVEALFLDEGFGTLDANILGDALDTLTKQAREGRLVAVISHMRDVALHFDDILMVNARPEGSKATWLTPAERDALIEDEARNLLA